MEDDQRFRRTRHKILISTQVRGDPEKLLEQVGPGLVFSVEGVVLAQGLTLKDYQCDKAVGAISRDEYKRRPCSLGHVAFLMSLPCLVLATLFKTQFMYAELCQSEGLYPSTT